MTRHTKARRPRAALELAGCLAALSACVACSEQLVGPTPALGGDDTLPVAPAIVCGDQLTTTLELNGARFTPVPVNVPKHPVIALPSLTLTRSAALDGASADAVAVVYGGDPTRPFNSDALHWIDQRHMQFTIDQQRSIGDQIGRVPAGIYDARVMNPNGEQSEAKAVLAVVDKPELSQVTPTLLCLSDAERELALSGSGLLRIGEARPVLELSGLDGPLDVQDLADCSAVAQPHSDAESCATGRWLLPRAAIAPGLIELGLTNPETAACRSEAAPGLRVAPAPVIDSLVPGVLCTLDKQQPLRIFGQGFLEVDGAPPSVKLAGQPASAVELDSCEELATPGLTVRTCKELRLSVDSSAFQVGGIDVSVENPQPAGCAAATSDLLRVVAPPQIRKIEPRVLCSEGQSSVTLSGSRFDSGATASIDGVAVDVNSVSASELRIEALALAPGKHDLELINAGRCRVSAPEALEVQPSPVVFYVDPPVLYSAVPVEVTVYTSGLTGDAAEVAIETSTGDDHQVLSFANPTRPNQILAQTPAGLSTGRWDLAVKSAGGCAGSLDGALTVTSSLAQALLSSIKPSYASSMEDTAVTISGEGFLPVPRVYLTGAAVSGSARALRAVEVSADGNTLTAVIPSGLAAGTYDLIVVNPDGKVAVLDEGVTITADAPPVITSVTPSSLPANASGAPITVAGSGFKPNLQVALDCLTANAVHTTINATAQTPNGAGTSVVAQVTMSNASPAPVDAGNVCLVRLTNADGAFFEYSALSVTNSSLNLAPWQAAPALQTARRGLSLVAGRPTASSRFLYALGGDEGTATPSEPGARVFDSIESSRVDVFGALSAWTTQRNRLTAPRTAAGAVGIGRFVYLIGGYDGSSATDSVLRAAILDPLAGPEIVDLDISLSDGQSGLGGGLYYYRVAALMTDSDLFNPGGEGLSGELLPVQLPERPERIKLKLAWASVPGAHGYRIYRSPAAGAPASSCELLGVVSCGAADVACDCADDPTRCQFLDEGGETDARQTPLPAGSLGRWHAVDGARCSGADCTLASAREGLVVSAVQDPGDSGRHYLYAFGGRDQHGSYLDSYEVASVTVEGDGRQTVSPFGAGADTLSSPRADLGVWVMSRYNASVIASSASPDDVWIFVGGGRKAEGAPDSALQAAKLGAGGVLSTFSSTDPLSGSLIGFSTGASNDQLYTFGGVAGSADGTSAKLCDGSGSCGPLPDLKAGAFNALGAATTRRMFGGSTQESAFFFVVGGHDGARAITSVQSTVQ